MDLSKIFDKTIRGEMKGEGVNIIQFSSILVGFSSMCFFLFQSLDVRASENLSTSYIFQSDLL